MEEISLFLSSWQLKLSLNSGIDSYANSVQVEHVNLMGGKPSKAMKPQLLIICLLIVIYTLSAQAQSSPPSCDEGLSISSSNPLEAARAMGICEGLISAEWVLPDGSAPPNNSNFHLGYGLLSSFGAVAPLEGSRVLALSTGTARGINDSGYLANLDKGYSHNVPATGISICPTSTTGFDGVGLKVTLKVPPQTSHLSYQYKFYTKDYPHNLCLDWSDQAGVFLNSTNFHGNVLYDVNGNFNTNGMMLTQCVNQVTNIGFHSMCVGTIDLEGTQFKPDPNGGATSWIYNTIPVEADEIIDITFAIWDMDDGIETSTILFDDWKWECPTCQEISFNTIEEKTYGASPFNLNATSSSGLPVTYTSSDPATVSITENTATVIKAGTVTITASQVGNDYYRPAPSVQQTLTINKAPLTAKADNKAKTYGATNPSLTISYTGFANNDNANAITAPSITTSATASSNAGSFPITLAGGSATNYTLTLQNGTLTVNKAPLTVTADDKSRTYNTANPSFTITYTGFVNGDNANSIAAPTATTTATPSSNVGTYSITPAGGSSSNYSFTYLSGTLTITKADQSITFPVLPSKEVGASPFALAAESSSGLSVTYSSSNTSVATISGNTVTIVGAGNTGIIATQPGNGNYNAATPVVQVLTVTQPKSSQTISFTSIADKTIGEPAFHISATASSGLSVTFSSSSSKITINGTLVTLLEAGYVTLLANQSGNEQYNPAPQVSNSFCIKPSKPIITVSTNNSEIPILTSSSSVGNQWYRNGTPINGATNTTYSVTEPGAYTVSVTIDNCTSEASTGYNVIITDVEDLERNLKIYPNPVHETLHLVLPGNSVKETVIVVYDLHGRIKERIATSLSDLDIVVNDYAAGPYILSVQQSDTIHHLKFIKR